MLNLVSLSTQSLASCVNYFVWNCLTCFSNTKIGSVTSFSILFNFQGPVRLSLAADDLIILPQKWFFVKYFFQKLFDSFEHKFRFSAFPHWFFRFASAAFRSHSFRRPLALKYNTTSPAFCQHFFASFLSFFYISQKECFRAGFEPLRNGHGHFVSPLPRGEPLQFPGRCYII